METAQQATIIRYDIVDLKEKMIVGTAKTRQRANVSADKRNLEYGAHRYSVNAVWSDKA